MYHDSYIYEHPNCINIRSNISSHQSKLLTLLFDMAFVASNAENGFVITPPIKESVHPEKTRAEYEKRYEANVAASQENFARNISLSKKLDKKVGAREFLFNEISSIYPDFCRNMNKKITDSDYELYRSSKKSLKSALFYDSSSYLSFSELLSTYKAKLSKVIESEEFSTACGIEDHFVISELDKFFEILSSLPREQSRHFLKKSIKLESGEHVSISDLVTKVRTERVEREKKYSKIHELFERLRENSSIRIKQINHDDETK